MNLKKMLINFRKDYSAIIPFVSVIKEEIYKYMQYEVLSIWTAHQGKVPKWLPFKNYKSESQNI